MRMYDIIEKKKLGEELSDEEIRWFVSEYTEGNIPDYQVSALMMAVYFKSMSDRETATLTAAIAESGKMLDLSEFGELSTDKHSTGGVGDKTTLIVAPLAASVGCKVAKISGRGLGHTGGTVDKLESFPGFNTSLTADEFFEQVRNIGISVIGQSEGIAPADKKLYALRDVTATVNSIPLITSSIMGKKLAAGSKNIVLDVKYGSGGFMKTAENAEILAKNMVEIGKRNGRRITALITNMDVPLGYNIGNSLEVIEAISVLRGEGPDDLRTICIELASAMCSSALSLNIDEAKARVTDALYSGKAFEKFKEWISAQGSDASYAENTELFPKAAFTYELRAKKEGYISSMDAEMIGNAATILGAGRASKEDEIDHSAGIILRKKNGDYLSRGDVIMTLLTNDESRIPSAEKMAAGAITLADNAPELMPLIHKIVI